MLELQDKAAAYKALLWLKPVYLLGFLALLAQAVPVLAEWNYASSPLLQSVGVKPNVVLMLDDSSSMSNLAPSQAFSDYINAPSGSALAQKYHDDWFMCLSYDSTRKVCLTASTYSMNIFDGPVDGYIQHAGVPCDPSTGIIGTGTGAAMTNNAAHPDPKDGYTVTGGSQTHRTVNACVGRVPNANTAIVGSTMLPNAAGYPVGSNADGSRTDLSSRYFNFLLNQTFMDGTRNELLSPAVSGATAANRLVFNMSTSPFVSRINRMQTMRTVVNKLVTTQASALNIGLCRLWDTSRSTSTICTVPCAAGDDAHIAALTNEVNTVYKAITNITPLARTQSTINDIFAGAASPIKYSCQQNNVIVLTDGDPASDFYEGYLYDSDGADDSAFSGESLLDDLAETGFKTDYKTGGVDGAGVSWDDPTNNGANKTQNIRGVYTIGFGASNDLLRMTPLVNRVQVPAADIAIKSTTLPNGSIKISGHGLKTGDPVMYEVITKTGIGIYSSSSTTKTTGLLQTTTGDLPAHTADADNNTPGLYFTIRLDGDHFALATSRNNALAVPPVGIPITDAGTGTHAFSTGPGKSYITSSGAELDSALTDALAKIIGQSLSMSTVSASTSDLSANNRIYQTRFQTNDWSGSLTAYKLNTGTGVVDTTAPVWVSNWAEGDVTASTLTWNPAKKGSFFDWASLDATQKAALHNRTDVVDWLLGNAVAGLRNRDNGMLGDTLNASAQYMGATDEGYGVLSGAEGSRYAAFVTSKTARKPMLWFGAGAMLHGVDASDAGQGEMLVHYIPNGVFRDFTDTNNNGVMDTGVETTGAVDKLFQFAQSDYGKSSNPHRLFVDGSPTVGDAYWAGAWHTVVVGGAGFGGRFLYALEASPTSIYSGGDVLWERGADDDSVDATSTNNSLGYTFSKPVIGRMANGDWAAIVGNGYDSGGDKAQLFILRLSDGAVLKQIDTKAGSATNPNGMSSVQVKLGGADGKTVQTVYGGDLLGNIWKFDVSDSSTSNWQTAFGTVAAPLPLFTATDINGNNKPQPITGGIALKDRGGDTLVFFGTGKYFETSDNTYPPIDGGPLLNTVYGLFDNGTTMTRSQMGRQTIDTRTTDAGTTYRIGSSIETNYTNWRGWYLDLTKDGLVAGAGERVITAPIVHGDRLIFVTITPKTGADPCTDSSKSALFEINAFTGGSLGKAVFDTNGDGEVDDKDAVVMSIESDTVWSPPQILKQVGARGKMIERKVMGSSSAAPPITTLKEGSAEADRDPLSGGRTSWRQLQ